MFKKIAGIVLKGIVMVVVAGSASGAVENGITGGQHSDPNRLPGPPNSTHAGFGTFLQILNSETMDQSIATGNSDAEIYDRSTELRNGPYTGLVVDARALQLENCMSPRILFPDGSEVWGTIQTKPEKVIEYGIVSYYRQFGEAVQNERIGNNPLVIKAVSVDGVLKCNVVVSEEDGMRILLANLRSGILERLAIGFLK